MQMPSLDTILTFLGIIGAGGVVGAYVKRHVSLQRVVSIGLTVAGELLRAIRSRDEIADATQIDEWLERFLRTAAALGIEPTPNQVSKTVAKVREQFVQYNIARAKTMTDKNAAYALAAVERWKALEQRAIELRKGWARPGAP